MNQGAFLKTTILLPLAGILFLTACHPQPSALEGGQASQTAKVSPPTNVASSDKPGSLAPAALLPRPALAIPAGTKLQVRVNETLNTKRNRPGDRFSAVLESPVVVGETVALPRGTLFRGHVATAYSSGRFKGRAALSLALDAFERDGVRYGIDTSANRRVSGRHRKRNWTLIGGGAGVGAALGAIAGGGTGALIGAGAGTAAGAAGAALTGKKQVSLPAETLLTFTLRHGVTIPGPRSQL